jgi:hypothetical protein
MFGGTLRRDNGWLLESSMIRASETGFLMPTYQISRFTRRGAMSSCGHTRHCSASTTPAEMVDHCCITFNVPIHVEIASVASICDFFVFHTLDCFFYCVHGGATRSHNPHTSQSRTRGVNTRRTLTTCSTYSAHTPRWIFSLAML